MDTSNIRAISFDCYGTLIDWQTGILAALTSLTSLPPQELLRRFAQAERTAEQPPYRPYRAVLRDVAADILGADSPHLDVLWKSVGMWPAFPDTVASLRRLQARFRVAIASNVDRDLVAGTLPRLGVTPDVVVLAQDVASYKPGRAHFDALLQQLNLPAHHILHAGESRFHDVIPATALGFPTAWVHRVQQGHSASGDDVAQASLTVDRMTALADVLGC